MATAAGPLSVYERPVRLHRSAGRFWPSPTVEVARCYDRFRCYPVIRLNHSRMMLETEEHVTQDGRSGVPDLDDSSILKAVIQGRTGTGRYRPTIAVGVDDLDVRNGTRTGRSDPIVGA